MKNLLDFALYDRIFARAGMSCNFHSEICEMINRRIDIFAEYSFLPSRYVIESIDLTKTHQELLDIYGSNIVDAKTTFNLKKFIPRFLEYIANYKNFLVNCSDFKSSGFMAAKIMEEYVTMQIIKDAHFGTIMYIDTDLLMQDYKEIISINKSNNGVVDYATQLTYGKEVLYKLIYTADFIFWDKFDTANTNFEKDKIYEILTRRYKDCLGNAFLTSNADSPLNALRGVDERLLLVMDLANTDCYECGKDVYYIERCKRDND